MREKTKVIVGLVLIVAFFILISAWVQNNIGFLRSYVDEGFLGMFAYFLIVVLSIVFAPVNEIVMIPVATAIWGWFNAALLTLLGWTIGSSIAFLIARRYGAPAIKKFSSISRVYEYQKFIPQEHKFFGIIFLRILIPIDVISYALGFFVNIRFFEYFFATLIGFLPLAFFLAYVGTLSGYIQIAGAIIISLIFFFGYLFSKKKA